jgi:hypothetical protein
LVIDRKVLVLGMFLCTFFLKIFFTFVQLELVKRFLNALHDGVIFVNLILFFVIVVCIRFIDQTLLVKSVKFVHSIHANDVEYTETLEEN